MSQLITEPEKIRLQEEEDVQAILGRPPGWLTRWGVTLVLIGVVLLLLLGNWLRYPDIVEAPAIILGEDPPVRLVAKGNVSVDHLWVEDGAMVDSGQLLLSFQSPVALADVQLLEDQLKVLIPAVENRNINNIQLPHGLQLADLQPHYSLLSEQFEAQRYRLAQDDVQRRLTILEEELEQIRQLNRLTDIVIDTLEEEVAIAKNNQEAYLGLYQKGGISQEEYEKAKRDYLRYQRELQSEKSAYAQNELEAKIRQNQIITLGQEQNNEIKKGWRSLLEAARQMQAKINEWQELHLLKSPMPGQVIFSEIWSNFQSVNTGQIMLTINPAGTSRPITIRAKLPVAKSGKVHEGQEVLLRLQAYPYKEFGVLEGVVSDMAPLPEPGDTPYYRLRIELIADRLITTSKKEIPFTQEMYATARIITEDRSFLGRVMDELTSLFERN